MADNFTPLNCTPGEPYNYTQCFVGNGTDTFFCNTTEVVCEPPNADIEFAISLLVNLGVAAAFLLWFLFWKKRLPQIFEPMSDPKKGGVKTVASPSGGLFGWAYSAFHISYGDLERTRGLDGVVYLAFLKYCFWMFAVMAVFGILVLFPCHWLSSSRFVGLDRLTMANVPQGSVWLTADVISVFVNTIIANIGLFLLYRRYTRLRTRFRRRHAKPEHFAVMVRECPATREEVYKAFESVFPGRVLSVRQAFHTWRLWHLMHHRERIGKKFEKAQAKELKGKHYRATTCETGACFCCIGRRLENPVDFFRIRFDEVTEQIKFKQEHDNHTSANVFFVLFKDRTSAQLAGLVRSNFMLYDFKHPVQKYWNIAPAPAIHTINWDHLHVSHTSRFIRSIIVNIVTFFLIFFWLIPVTFVAGFTNLEYLSRLPAFSWLLPVVDALPGLRDFIEGFLPGLAYLIFNFILYDFIITPLAKAERHPDNFMTARSIFNKFFLFQVFNTFLGSVLIGGAIQVIFEILNNPTVIVQLLADTIPHQWIVFLSIVMISALGDSTKDIADLGGVIKYYLWRAIGKTKRQLRKAENLRTIDYSEKYAYHMLTFLIACSYSTLAPFVLIFVCLYFGLYYLYHRYLICFVYYPSEPYDGRMSPTIYTRCVWSLIVYHVVVGGTLGLSVFPAAAAIFVLAVVQLLVLRWMQRTFEDLAVYGAVCVDKPKSAPTEPRRSSKLKKRVREKLHLQPADEPVMRQEGDLVPHPDTYTYPTMRTTFDFELEDQRPEFVYDVPVWPDRHDADLILDPVWMPLDEAEILAQRFREGVPYDDEAEEDGGDDDDHESSMKNGAFSATHVDLAEELDVVDGPRPRGELVVEGQRVMRRGHINGPARRVPADYETDGMYDVELGQSFGRGGIREDQIDLGESFELKNK